MRRVLVSAVAALVLAVMAVPASAQTGPYPLSGAIQCDRSVTSPGTAVVCTGDGFAPDGRVDVVATGSTVDRAGTASFAAGTWEYTTTVTADEVGLATATIQVPSDAVGPASVSFTGLAPNGTDRTLRAIGAFTVVAPVAADGLLDGGVADDGGDAAADGGGLLSNTGAPFVLGGIAVAVLFVLGALLLMLGGRRRIRV